MALTLKVNIVKNHAIKTIQVSDQRQASPFNLCSVISSTVWRT